MQCELSVRKRIDEDTKEPILPKEAFAQWSFAEDDQYISIRLAKLTIKINKKTASISYYRQMAHVC